MTWNRNRSMYSRPRLQRALLAMVLGCGWCAACSDEPLDSFPPTDTFQAADGFIFDGAPGPDAGPDSTPGDGCVPSSCKAQGKNCGTIGDRCGGTLPCGKCGNDQVCGLGEVANICGKLPPDPGKVAPPLDRTVATTVAGSAAFLYSGSPAIQTGVASGTITARRAAVLRGRVLDRAAKPVPGVKVTVMGHPEYGLTYTRLDGWFDLVVNGGDPLVLRLARTGYLPVQRRVRPPWQDSTVIDDVALTTLDPAVSTITAGHSAMQLARGSTVKDSSGTRRATLLVAAGTTATITPAGKPAQSLASIKLRATELSSGADGPAAAPGLLPAAAAYTYVVQLTADEALAAGADHVTLSKPAVGYVEDFIGFPVGGAVPAAYYDRQLQRWIPSDNGLVLRVVSITGGLAELDLDGKGAAAGAAELAKLGISDAERKQLAALYTKGQRLWRVPLSRIAAWTLGWSWGVPATAVSPALPEPPSHSLVRAPCVVREGVTIECQNQALGLDLPVVGTPFSLHYQSARADDRKTAMTLELALSGASVAPGLQRIELQIAVAGQRLSKSFSAAPNLQYSFTWDGKDAYGRAVQGKQPVTARVGYVYAGSYHKPAALKQSYGHLGAGALSTKTRQQPTLWQTTRSLVGRWDASGLGLGGFSMDAHHAYSPVSRVLYLGDGRRRSAAASKDAITAVAGNGTPGNSGDKGPATSAEMYTTHVAVDGRGNLYVTGAKCNCVRKVDLKGIVTLVAGDGTAGFKGDNGPAISAQLNQPQAAAPDGRGNLYIADSFNHRIRRVDAKGIITTVAGIGTVGYSGDSGPAAAASLAWPEGVAPGPDGAVYIADTGNSCIRRVGPDGIITTLAGAGCTAANGCTAGHSGDNGPAANAMVNKPRGVLPDSRGMIYIADTGNNRVRRVSPDGVITAVAGTGIGGHSGDGGPAVKAKLDQPQGLALDLSGRLFFADNGGHAVRRVGHDGVISTVAGVGQPGTFVDKAPATSQRLHNPSAVAAGNASELYVADDLSWRVGRVLEPLPQLSGGSLVIASRDGTRLFTFDAAGRHQSTKDALSGATLFGFSYDTRGLLTKITDGHGNATTIKRNSSGRPVAVVAPMGQSTALASGAGGYLASVSNPAGESHGFTFSSGGLLTGRTDPRGKSHGYSYSSGGRLSKVQDPLGAITLTRASAAGGSFSVTATTSLGRATKYSVVPLAGRRLNQTVTFPDGLQSAAAELSDGSTKVTLPDGTTAELMPGPDPRHGMQAPLTASSSLGFKGSAVASAQVSASSWTALKVLLNGRTYSSAYGVVSKRITQLSPEGRQILVDVDSKGRVFALLRPGRADQRPSFDSAGRLASISAGALPPFRDHTLAYSSSSGLLSSVTDPLSRSVTVARDAAGRVTSKTLPGGAKVLYGWDKSGNMTSLTPPGKAAHGLSYNDVDLVASYTPPPASAALTTSYAYDKDHQLVQITRPDASKVTLTRDQAGRPGSVALPGGGKLAYSYSATSGRLAGITSPDGITLGYTWDVAGRPASVTWSGAVSGSFSQTHDSDLRVVSERVNGASEIKLSHDKDGLLVQVGALTIKRAATSGLVTGSTLGKVTTTRTHDSHGDLSGLSASSGAATVYSASYTRDLLGRVTKVTESVDGTTSSYGYTYSAAGRLATVTRDSVLVATYTHDLNGNRTSYTGANKITINAAHDVQDRITARGATSYAYNTNGELISHTTAGKTTKYTHDGLGSLTSAALPGGSSITYLYDGRGRRVGKKLNGSLVQGLLYRDQLSPVAELDSSGKVVSRFIYDTRDHVPAAMFKGGKTYRIITDHRGSPRVVLDTATGSVAQRLDYDELGRVVKDTSPGFQPFGFAGGILDQHTGLVRFGARDYDPRSGRWITRRPAGFGRWSTNLYEYARGDPINLIDPSGLQVTTLRPAGLPGPALDRLARGHCRQQRPVAPDGGLLRLSPPATATLPCYSPTLGDLLCRPRSWASGSARMRKISFR